MTFLITVQATSQSPQLACCSTQNASATTQICDYQASGNCINDMWNANGGHYSATLTGYHPKSTQEWVRDDGVVFNQASGYRAIDFCPSLKTTDQTVNLKVNW